VSEPLTADVAERIYAGVLGKLIGVYMGRPVEGWPYERIRERFDTVQYFVAEKVGAPLIVPDDDISGTFVFVRAIEDNPDARPLDARTIGDTWLNYIVENKTVLWWGGLSRSTEHTAFLRLKSGIPAPLSGSIELNGRSMAEQIGAEIFIDSWAMANPGDPERAVAMARQAASVSHDGLAVGAACLLAAMESFAFVERDLEVLIATGLSLVPGTRLHQLVEDVVKVCTAADEWRSARDWIESHHGYARYPGNCPMATNHAAVLMALLMAGDDFARSVSIATSAGWDTDCNAGNVGCLNGIRLGLAGIGAGADFRGPVADRMYAVSADGGECMSDAVRETRKLLVAASRIRGETLQLPAARFSFDYPGSVQGWVPHPALGVEQAVTRLDNDGGGLLVGYDALAPGVRGAVSVNTFSDPRPTGVAGTSYFDVVSSPSIYPTQTLRATVRADDGAAPRLAFFVDTYGDDGAIETIRGAPTQLAAGANKLTWTAPDTGGRPIYRLGIELTATSRTRGAVRIEEVDWSGAPADFVLGRATELSPQLSPWTTDTVWLRSFVSSAFNFAPDHTTTFCLSHPERNGVVTTGTRDWKDYAVSSRITFNQQDGAGLVARTRGHRRYYAAVLAGAEAQIIRQRDGVETVLASSPFDYAVDDVFDLEFRVHGDALDLLIDGDRLVQTTDSSHDSGGAGLVVHRGAILADGFRVSALGAPA
jgi:ADP-ribosylglycohydrolase